MIRQKLFLGNTAALIATTVILALSIFLLSSFNLKKSVDDELDLKASKVQTLLRTMKSSLPPEADIPVEERLRVDDSVGIYLGLPRVFDLNGTPMLPLGGSAPWDPNNMKPERDQVLYSSVNIKGKEFRVISRQVTLTADSIGVLQIGRDMTPIQEEIGRLGRTLLITLPCIWLVAIGLGQVLTRSALKPVSNLITASKNALSLGGNEQLPVEGNDEMAQLASTVNDLFELHRRAYRRLDQFTADASHELRTPLATIIATASSPANRTSSAEELRTRMKAIESSASGLSTMVDDLLLLARTNEQRLLVRESVNLAYIAGEVVDEFVADYGERIEFAFDSNLMVFADAQLMKRAFRNLVENAFKHGGPSVRLKVSGKVDQSFCYVHFRDDGVGISAEDLPQIFERYFQVDEARDKGKTAGVGLGLAIVKSVVQSCGGELLADSTIGKGTTITIKIPADQTWLLGHLGYFPQDEDLSG